MFSRILVAVDGSASSDHAVGEAVQLAKAESARLQLLHVVDMGVLPVAPELAIDVEEITKARRLAGEKILASARELARAAGLEAEASLVETATPVQHVADVISEEATRWSAQLVVLGKHGHRGAIQYLMGSVADGVARRTTLPLLLIPMP